jgi:hypothetical protein
LGLGLGLWRLPQLAAQLVQLVKELVRVAAPAPPLMQLLPQAPHLTPCLVRLVHRTVDVTAGGLRRASRVAPLRLHLLGLAARAWLGLGWE